MQPYHHFTMDERISLQQYLEKNLTQTEIARLLGKSKSAVSREIKRNSGEDNKYKASKATLKYIERRSHCRKPQRIEKDLPLKEFILDCFKKYYSPETIVALWKKRHPKTKLSHSTLYFAVKNGLLEKIKPEKHLRRRGRRRKNHNTATIKPEHTIHERPQIINERGRIGDWEGDTVLGANQKSALVTMVDRKSRFLAVSIVIGKSSKSVANGIEKALKRLPVKSITLDNGSEFAMFREIEKQLKTTIYFADVRSPWQRGSNENMNGLLRFFFPQGTDFSKVTEYRLKQVIALINNRPRKCLNWLTPVQVFTSCT